MLLHVPGVFTLAEARTLRDRLEAAPWTDGNETSGAQSALAKANRQLPERSEAAIELGRLVTETLQAHPVFVSAALPHTIFPPLFSRYEGGDRFDTHVDNAIRQRHGVRIRSDLSATLFLSEPDAYDGGELVVEELYGPQVVRPGAGDLVLYPSKSLHRVTPVTRGVRYAAVFWLQSLVRDDADRETLFRLDVATQRVVADRGAQDPAALELTGVYHNLLRRWAEV